MAAETLTTLTEQWIRERLQLKHTYLGDVRSLRLPGTCEEKIRHLGNAFTNFIRLKSLDLSYNALVSVEGVQHLKMLERLILYYNCIPSLEEVTMLFELRALKELDLRLNPLTKSCRDYRPYLVHCMPSLRKLDDCSISDTERKVAIVQFSSDLPLQPKGSSLNVAENLRSGDQRSALVNSLTKRLSLPTDTQDVVLNFVTASHGGQSETIYDSIYNEANEPKEKDPDYKEQRSSTPKQEYAKSILRHPYTKRDNSESKGQQINEHTHRNSSTSSKVAERPKVSFWPFIEKHRPVTGKQRDLPKQSRHVAKGHFTPNPGQSVGQGSSLINIRPPSPLRPGLNLSDPSNPILHPARLTYANFNKTEGSSHQQPQAEKKKRGSYRKPLEMLLNLVDKHWRGERSLHQNNNFLTQAVQILSMMESDISSREAEVMTLRRDVDALNRQAVSREEEHNAETQNLSAQLEDAHKAAGKLNEQLRIVLEENVALQKQLIKLERQYLKSMMKSSPISQIREAQSEVEELKKEIEGLRNKVQEAEKVQELSNMLQESHRSLVDTNTRLLAELKDGGDQRD
ncbi:centrosomal protein of 72 kDa [Menidia menidia]